MKAFSKVLLTGALALGGLTVMNIETPKAHADEWDGCHYICGPGETVNGVTVQVHATEYSFGQNVIARITNKRAEDIHYNVSIEKKYGDNWGEYDTFFHWQNQWAQLEVTMKFLLSQDMAKTFQTMEHIAIKLKL